MMQSFSQLSGQVLVLNQQNIDTDQIIPARYLTTTTFDALGAHAFADWRTDADGNERADCVLNQPRARHSPILVAGHNFGCGSSREHAPHALLDFGFRVVISSGIADIFRNNAQNIGLLPIVLPTRQHWQLLEMDGQSINVDLESCSIKLRGQHGSDTCFSFEIDSFARHCMLHGVDRLDFLLEQDTAIAAHEKSHEKGS